MVFGDRWMTGSMRFRCSFLTAPEVWRDEIADTSLNKMNGSCLNSVAYNENIHLKESRSHEISRIHSRKSLCTPKRIPKPPPQRLKNLLLIPRSNIFLPDNPPNLPPKFLPLRPRRTGRSRNLPRRQTGRCRRRRDVFQNHDGQLSVVDTLAKHLMQGFSIADRLVFVQETDCKGIEFLGFGEAGF